MQSLKPVLMATLLAGISLVVTPFRASAATPGPCTPGALPSGALSLICVPSDGWNGELVVFAHGYVPVNQPLGFYNLTLSDGTNLPLLIESLGFAFATTSYRQNGLTILEGASDIRELLTGFSRTYSIPIRTYMTGVSEGGLVTALLAERSPELFTGGLATCGPIGSFTAQIDYIGDFRVLFDYYFPNLIPGEANHIPPTVISNWYDQYVPAIVAALQADPATTAELLHVANAAFDPANPATLVSTTLDVLWYSVFGTNDLFSKLGGNPFENQDRSYSGSSDDVELNRHVHRFNASKAALKALQAYETSGDLSIPLVTLHTTLDDVVPYEQEARYAAKVSLSDLGAFVPLSVSRYGHCNFRAAEVLAAFSTLLSLP